LRLLILLSAMIAGLTGLIAGDPAAARGGEPTSIAASAVAATEQVRATRQVVRIATAPHGVTSVLEHARLERSFTSQSHKVDERRNE
jgi:hypothetical protein